MLEGRYNIAGEMSKREIVSIYKNQNISSNITIYRIIKECEEIFNHSRLQNIIKFKHFTCRSYQSKEKLPEIILNVKSDKCVQNRVIRDSSKMINTKTY